MEQIDETQNHENLFETDETVVEPVEKISPVAKNNRIQMLDELRGFALLGILIMNIQNFGLFEAGYSNPYYLGVPDAINAMAYNFTHLIADMKMMTLFSILFGAGMMLFIEKAKQKQANPGKLHYKRMFWLLVFGLIHAFFIWHGDILLPYAIGGMIIYLMRNLSPAWLLGIGLVFCSITSLAIFSVGLMEQFASAEEVTEMREQMWVTTEEKQAEEVAIFRAGYVEQFKSRVEFNTEMYSLGLLIFIWRIIGNMLIGMALFKWGVITNQRSKRFYRNFTIGFLLLGFTMVGVGLKFRYDIAFDFLPSFAYFGNLNYWGSIAVALGYIGLFGLWTNSDVAVNFRKRLAAVGRMAFTNYIMQSILCAFIFYGIGLALFEHLERYQLNFVVLAIWLLQLIISPIWLKTYRFGPLEWLWRVLTYGKIQAMKRENPAS